MALKVVEGIASAEREGADVIDLPAVLALYAVVRTSDQGSEAIDTPLVARPVQVRTTGGPGSNLLLFKGRKLV